MILTFDKISSLTNDEKTALEINKPFVLKNFIFKRPTAEEENVMMEMFEASYNSEPYDVVKWSKFFKPNNVFFDADGNIKDLKSNTNATTQAREIPTSQVQQFVQETVSTTVQQPIVQQTVVQQPTMTAPQIISQHTEAVSGENPKDVINSILGKYNIQTNN